MATISSAGVGSGLDVNSIISQLVALERKPIDALRSTQTRIQTQISSYGKLQSSLARLQDAAKALTGTGPWGARMATSGDATLFDAKVTGRGPTGPYTVRPTTLALQQSNASTTFAARDSVVGQGSLTIELGTWTGTTSFAPATDPPPVTITIGPGEDTLEKIRDKINAADAGVDAAVIFDGGAYRLTLTSAKSGAAYGFRTTVADADGNNTNAAGLSRLAYDPPGGANRLTRSQAGTDAVALVNSLSVRNPSNTFDQVIEGVSFTIKKTSTTAATLDLAFDGAAMKKSVEDFVAAYNEMNKLARDLTRVDATNPTSNGALQGDRSVHNLQGQLRTMLSQSGASSVFGRLADVGISAATDGSLKIDSTKLDAALARPDELRKLFDGNGSTQPGVAKRFDDLIDNLLDSDGMVSSRTSGLQDRLERSQQDEERIEQRVANTEQRLRAQYTALDRSMGQLSGLSSYVTQQMQALNNFYNNNSGR
jgi:flagellar hook-associated protein 2